MDFTLTEDQELLRSSARSMLAKECTTDVVRAHVDDRSAAEPLWRHLAEWTGLATGPMTDLCLFLEETGAVVAPGPFLAAVVYAGAGLPGLGTLAVAGTDGQWVPNDDPVKSFVLDADLVDHVGFVRADGSVLVADRAGLDLRPVRTVDFSRRVFEVPAPSSGDRVDGDVAGALERAFVAIAAEHVGTARTVFDMALAYAKERIQFDRPIGSFQAIQHKLANMALALERARSAVYYAAMTIDAGEPDRHRAVHVAKAEAGEAAHLIGKDAIQIHGGIGFTWEHDLHLFCRRAFGNEHLLGSVGWHHDRLADLILV